MSLRYTFRHLFYGGKIQKERLYEVLKDLDSANGGDASDISALETVVGDSSKGLVKDVADAQSDITALETTVGDSSSGLVKDVADIETAIGDESTANSILGRIKALEDAQTPANTPEEPSG